MMTMAMNMKIIMRTTKKKEDDHDYYHLYDNNQQDHNNHNPDHKYDHDNQYDHNHYDHERLDHHRCDYDDNGVHVHEFNLIIVIMLIVNTQKRVSHLNCIGRFVQDVDEFYDSMRCFIQIENWLKRV